MNLKDRAKNLKIKLPAVYLSLRDPETPLPVKILAGLTVGYALSPIDLIPDFIPVLGYLDDLLLLPGLIAWTVKCIPKSVWIRSLAAASDLWPDGRPRKWYFAIPVVLLWLLLLWLIVKSVYH